MEARIAMQIKRLDHVNIVTTRLDDMVAWYSDILGLKPGWRPDFDFPGAWLYAGDNAVVHLIGTDETGAVGAESPLKLEHFAFSAQGREGFESRLKSGDHLSPIREQRDRRRCVQCLGPGWQPYSCGFRSAGITPLISVDG